MARRFPARVVRGTKSDRQTQWIGVDISLVTVAANTKVLAGVLNAGALALRPFTVVRSRLLFQLESDQTAASEVTRGAIGAIVVSEQATAAGAGSIPGPHQEADSSGWFVWEPFINSFLFLDATSFNEPNGYMKVVDSKAMRKVGPNEDVAIMFEVQGTPAVVISMQGRMLLKLH